MNKFKVGDKVKYVSGAHGDSYNNPLWEGMYGNIVGKVVESNDTALPISVAWALGGHNVYKPEDLAHVDGPEGNFKSIWDEAI